MPIASSYPHQHVPIVQSDSADLGYADSQGNSTIVGILPLVTGTITLRLADDDATDFPNGVAYPVQQGVPVIGRFTRVFATGTTLTNSQMVGLVINKM